MKTAVWSNYHRCTSYSQNTVFLKVSDVLRIKPLQVITTLAPYWNTVNSPIQPVVESSHMRTHSYSLTYINAHLDNACIKKSHVVAPVFFLFLVFLKVKENDLKVSEEQLTLQSHLKKKPKRCGIKAGTCFISKTQTLYIFQSVVPSENSHTPEIWALSECQGKVISQQSFFND